MLTILIIAIIVIAVGVGLGYYYTSISSQKFTIAITVAGADPIPLYWAYQNGLFKKYLPEADVETFPQGGGAVIDAITSGRAQIGFLNIFSILTAIAKGVPIKIVAVWDVSPYTAGVIVKNNSRYYNITQLKGKTFANSSPGSFDAVTLELMAGHLGWGNNYTKIYVGSPSAQIAAVLSGKADATLINIWTAYSVIQTQQVRLIYIVKQEWPAEYIVATNSFITQQPNLIVNVIKATYKIMQDYYSNTSSVIQFMKKYYNYTESTAIEYLHTVIYATNPSLAAINETAIKLAINALINAGVLPSNFTSISISSIYTNKFVLETAGSSASLILINIFMVNVARENLAFFI